MLQDIPIFTYSSLPEWETWLSKNYTQDTGVWLRIYKKNSSVKGITYDEALDVALCYGWIDSLLKKYDEHSYIQKFSPRRSKSVWSKINTQHVERLILESRMKDPGLRVVNEAKKDGRWNNAYTSSKEMTFPKEFLHALDKNKKAQLFFKTLNRTNTYAISWRLQTAKKPETRAKRIEKILSMLSQGEKFHP